MATAMQALQKDMPLPAPQPGAHRPVEHELTGFLASAGVRRVPVSGQPPLNGHLLQAGLQLVESRRCDHCHFWPSAEHEAVYSVTSAVSPGHQ